MPGADNCDVSQPSTGWFTPEIQNMMHGFGDVAHPLKETAELIEKIVKEQLLQIIELVTNAALKHGKSIIGVEEFLFIMRHSAVKLRRFCRYLRAQDFHKHIQSAAISTPETNDLEYLGHSELVFESKRLKAALSFLQQIDSSGFLATIADPNRECLLHDQSLKEREERIEYMTQAMNVNEYFEYSQARRSSFGKHGGAAKFKDWLLRSINIPNIKLTTTTWDVLNYLAYETVGQIIDLSFLVRRDKNAGQVQDLLERNIVTRPLPIGSYSNECFWSSYMQPLQPEEVLEALRRFSYSHSVIAGSIRNPTLPHKRILAL